MSEPSLGSALQGVLQLNQRDILELVASVNQLVAAQHATFHVDWEHTRDCLACDAEIPGEAYYIKPGATFLAPEVEDEDNNWSNRACFLKAYRGLVRFMLDKRILCCEPYGNPEDAL